MSEVEVTVTALAGEERQAFKALPWWPRYWEGLGWASRGWDLAVRLGEEAVTDPRLAVALVLARLGLPVVPRPAGEAGAPAGGEAGTDYATIAGWWARRPAADVAVPLGRAAGWAAVEVNCWNGGLTAWDLLAGTLGGTHRHDDAWPYVEVVSREPGKCWGTRTCLFRHPADPPAVAPAAIAPGVRVRGAGEVVVASPTRAIPNLLVGSMPDAYLVRSVDPAPWWLGRLEAADGVPAARGHEPTPAEAARLALLRALLGLGEALDVSVRERFTRRRRPHAPPRFTVDARLRGGV